MDCSKAARSSVAKTTTWGVSDSGRGIKVGLANTLDRRRNIARRPSGSFVLHQTLHLPIVILAANAAPILGFAHRDMIYALVRGDRYRYNTIEQSLMYPSVGVPACLTIDFTAYPKP